jgi:hypothetical protein
VAKTAVIHRFARLLAAAKTLRFLKFLAEVPISIVLEAEIYSVSDLHPDSNGSVDPDPSMQKLSPKKEKISKFQVWRVLRLGVWWLPEAWMSFVRVLEYIFDGYCQNTFSFSYKKKTSSGSGFSNSLDPDSAKYLGIRNTAGINVASGSGFKNGKNGKVLCV